MKDLPPELLILIFEKIKDPLNLLLLREVCTRWAEIIDYLFIKLKLWTEFCNSDYIQPWIHKIIEKRFPLVTRNEWKSLTEWNWKQVYLSYRTWQICHLFKNYLKILFNFDLPPYEARNQSITCMDVRADCLAIGSSTGIVYYFFIEESIQAMHTKKYQHYSITTIKLWYTDKKQLIAVISLNSRFLEFWDVLRKKSIPSSLMDHPSTAIVCDGDRLFIANGLEIFECVWNDNQIIKGKECALIRFPRDPTLQQIDIIYMNINPNNTLMAVRCDYSILITNTFRIPTHENSDFQRIIRGPIKYYENVQFRKQQFIFSYPTTDTFLIINDEHLHVCLKELGNYQWKIYVLKHPLSSNISAFFMHANVLLFGLKTGYLLVYVVKSVQHLHQFTTKPLFTRIFKIDNQPVTNLNVAEYNNILYIFVTMGNKLHVITFSFN